MRKAVWIFCLTVLAGSSFTFVGSAAAEDCKAPYEAGPIWNQDDAEAKCPGVCAQQDGFWTWQWWTIIWGQMSVCECNTDTDHDEVCADQDVCDSTDIPESVPSRRLGVNRFALTDGDVEFDSTPPPGGGGGPGLNFTTADTAGCSCEQIVMALELGRGHAKFGCSISAMQAWVSLVNP